MKYTKSNGYKISEMTLGTVQLGRAYGINNSKGMPSFEESGAILNTALSLGISTFDTANNYGESEAVLGRFFSENNAEKTTITKIGFENEKEDEVYESVFTQTRECAKPSLDKLHGIADDLGISMSQLAISYMRQQKGISSLVLGAETPEQVKDSASMFDAPPLPNSAIDKINEIAEEVPAVVIRPWE